METKSLQQIVNDLNATDSNYEDEKNIVEAKIVMPLVSYAHCRKPMLLVKTIVSRNKTSDLLPGVRWMTCQCCNYSIPETSYMVNDVKPPIGYKHGIPFFEALKIRFLESLICGEGRLW